MWWRSRYSLVESQSGDEEITVDSTHQDGTWTVHLKLDKTWHLDKILFKVS